MAIVFTGGLVRLTGSGLGCPTWPQCVAGSYTPVAIQPQGFHKEIEFTNRLLTFVLTVAILACLVAAWRMVPRRRPLVLLAGCGLLGIVVQAVLGGITVRTGLNPASVALHFLVSMPLIAAATILYERSGDAGDGPVRWLVRPELRWLSTALTAVAGVVIVLGTLVTGTGPHSGDADHEVRFGFNPQQITWLHSDVVLVFLGLVVALVFAVRLTDAPPAVRRRAWWVLGITLAQGAIGYTQYFTGVPWALVAVHIAGATVLWVTVLRLRFSMRARAAVQLPAGRPAAPEGATDGAGAVPSGDVAGSGDRGRPFDPVRRDPQPDRPRARGRAQHLTP